MSRPPRILIIVPRDYGPPWDEGAKNLAKSAARYLTQQGSEVCVASFTGLSNAFGQPLESKRTILKLKSPPILALIRDVRRATRNFRPDVTLLFTSCGSLLGFKTLILRRLLRSPLVIYVTGLRSRVFGFNYFLSADKVILGSPFLQSYFPTAGVITTFASIHLPAETQCPAINDYDNTTSYTRTFLFLGMWESGRGLEDLLKATAIVSEKVAVKLILALNSYSQIDERSDLKRLIKELGIESIVDIRGVVDVNAIYEEADVVVIPRNKPIRMAFPLRIVESLNMRKPLIVSKICDMHKLIDGCGLGVEPGNPEDLARAMSILATDNDLYYRFVANCDTKAEQFQPERSLQLLYKELNDAVLTSR